MLSDVCADRIARLRKETATPAERRIDAILFLFLFLFYSFISRDCPIASVLWLCLEDRPQRQEIQRFESGDNVLYHTQPPLGKSNLCS